MPVALWIPGCVLSNPRVLDPMILTSFATSLTVNALVTCLIVFRITKVYWEVVKPTLVGNTLRATGGDRLRPIIFIFIESGIALLCLQLAQIVLSVIDTNATIIVYPPIVGMGRMLNVIITFVIITCFFANIVDLARE